MSAILNAIGRGFTSNQIVKRLADNYPKYSNAILSAQAAGYTGSQILRKFHNNKTGQNLPEDAFLTEHEKTRKEDDKRKRNRALTVIGVLGTAGAIGAGLYKYANRNANVNPEVLPAIRGAQGRQQHTINIPNQQIGYQKKNLGYNQPLQIGQPGSNQPNQQPPPPQNSPQAPINKPPEPYRPLRDSLKNQRDPLQSIDMIRNMKVENPFKLMVQQGHDDETTAQLLKMTLPKEVVKNMEKVAGGLESVVEDYKNYLSNQSEKPSPPPQQQPNQQVPEIKPEIPQTQNQVQQPIQVQEQPKQIQRNEPIQNQIEQEIPKSNLAVLPKGQIGNVESIKNGVATVNVNGNIKKFKESEIQGAPQDLEQAVRHIVNNIPENMKSTSLQSTILVPLPDGNNIMLSQFYDGKIAWYLDVPENIYDDISLGTYAPKGQATTGIGEYKPSVADSRGAGFHTEIKMNPKYSKENKGKTWGYAKNSYSLTHEIQPILNKISKEKYDEKGNLITPKTRKKST